MLQLIFNKYFTSYLRKEIMEKLNLKWNVRTAEENIKLLRASKVIPAVVYWHKQEPIILKLDNSDLLRVYRVAWLNHVVNLEIDWKKMDVLFHEVQRNPITEEFLHIDFYAITAWEKVHTHIPLSFIGNSQAVAEWAILEELVKEIEVKCMPWDLVDNFEVDLTLLKEVWDSIKVEDLKISSKFDVLNTKDEVIALASKTRAEKIEDEDQVEENEEKTEA